MIPEEMKRCIGMVDPPIIFEIEKGAIRRYAEAVGDDNPLYRDEVYAAESRYKAQVDFGQPEFSIFRSVNEVTGQGDFAAAAQGESVDRRNHRYVKLLNFINGFLAFFSKIFCLERRKLCKLRYISPCNKRFGSGACENEHPDILIAGNVVQRVGQLIYQGAVESIQGFGPVEGNQGNGIPGFIRNVRVGHGFSPCLYLMFSIWCMVFRGFPVCLQ